MLSAIDPKRAMNLIWNYHHESPGKRSICVTYDVMELKKFIDQCVTDGDPKVRVYFGQYGENNVLNDPEKKGHKTVIFTPVNAKGEDDYTFEFLQPPFDEGQICPPPDPCAGALLYQGTEDSNYDHTEIH